MFLIVILFVAINITLPGKNIIISKIPVSNEVCSQMKFSFLRND